MTERVELVCPICRGLGPDGDFVAYQLEADGRCPGCGHVHRRHAERLSICLRRHGDEAVVMAERAESWARAWVAGAEPPDAPNHAAGHDDVWRDGAMVWAATHFGSLAQPPLAPPPWPWIQALGGTHPDAFHGPTLIMGGAAGGLIAQLPPRSGPFVVLDTSPWSLALGQALGHGQQLPFRDEPWRTTTATFAPSAELRQRLQGATWLVADALDPPFAAAAFGTVVLVDLLDSVADPWIVLQQAEALLRPGGSLLIAAPWCDRADICAPERWLSTLAHDAGFPSPTDALAAGALWQEPSLRCVWRQDGLPWVVRHHRRLSLHYRVDALLLRKAGALDPGV